jgi:hypothetical protein
MNNKEILDAVAKFLKPFFRLTRGIMIVGFTIFLVEFFSGTPIDTKQKQIILLGGGILGLFVESFKAMWDDI